MVALFKYALLVDASAECARPMVWPSSWVRVSETFVWSQNQQLPQPLFTTIAPEVISRYGVPGWLLPVEQKPPTASTPPQLVGLSISFFGSLKEMVTKPLLHWKPLPALSPAYSVTSDEPGMPSQPVAAACTAALDLVAPSLVSPWLS